MTWLHWSKSITWRDSVSPQRGVYQRIVPVFGNFAQNLALYNKNNRVLLFVVNIKFPRASYHTIVPSTEELNCLIGSLRSVWQAQRTSAKETIDRLVILTTVIILVITLSVPESVLETFKVVLTLESVDEILWCDYSNETSSAELFTWYYLEWIILQNEIWDFSWILILGTLGSERVKFLISVISLVHRKQVISE